MFGLLLVTGNQTHQENYARAFAADPRCRIIGLTTDQPGLPARRVGLDRALAAELGVPYLDDFGAALHREDVDLVCICADPERRGEIAVQCAQAGKHLYMDKEVAVTPEGVQAVVAAVQEQGVKSQTFSMVRTPVGARARQALAAGSLGTLHGLHCELFFAKGLGGTADLRQPRAESERAERFTFVDSKRELLCVGWYPLILFQWLTGQRVTQVFARTSNYFFAEHQKNNVEDFAALQLEYSGGLQATIFVGRTGWTSHPSHGIHQVQLVGSKGTALIDAYRPRLELYAAGTTWQPPDRPHPEDPMGFWTSTQRAGSVRPKTAWQPLHPALQSDASYFLDCLEQGRDSDVNAAAGAHIVEVILAAYRSAATGEAVAIPSH